ncbi:MAG: hypothetical protein UT86_C0002G0086 [Candidatus Magasanikbacteria bacterium GW2011_GWC2_40_17]|uniref:Chloroplast import component protein (Tic20) n=1 Tax=Candidatus Magasanikbacteria bacterium GW2011_GWA2_42_32 TaxID=1619039 RepID=A0A0G1A866_9BACT|nr:MAG: hypothetical protein UT86_C0002G0086 [Candidatus Magasanikbacteria bacterium GW2011_GWC2_40_17]KKS57247.1 MAG: hypothetical protein UV20_C0002G0036 [Candidatus Magasanikbacteria bacterium GW2011_GWA2_42_32]OGH86137.1 MAG: hypothetical protein A2294_02685 [Candidatus Magasanikbacteria bacterium RIFOXYB2_FULL_38_10]
MEPQIKKIPEQKDFEDNKIIAVIGYLGVLCLVPLLGRQNSPYAKFHGKQGLVLCLLWLVTWVLGWFPLLGLVLWIASIILTVVGISNAYQGKMDELPIIGKYAEKIKI